MFILKRSLKSFLEAFTHRPMEFRFIFQSVKHIDNFFPFKIVSLVIFARQSFTSLHVVAARLLIMARHHTISLLVAEST